MIELTLDGAMGMEAIHEQLAQTLHFPDFYGRNLDALYDCLTELQEDVTFTVQNVHALGRRGHSPVFRAVGDREVLDLEQRAAHAVRSPFMSAISSRYPCRSQGVSR